MAAGDVGVYKTRPGLVLQAFCLDHDACRMPSKKPAPCHIRERFGRNVAAMRKAGKATQEQMAEKTGLSTRYWQSLEAGEYFPQ